MEEGVGDGRGIGGEPQPMQAVAMVIALSQAILGQETQKEIEVWAGAMMVGCGGMVNCPNLPIHGVKLPAANCSKVFCPSELSRSVILIPPFSPHP